MKCRLAFFAKLEFLIEQKFHIFLSFWPTILVEELKKCSYFLNRCLCLNKICVEMITHGTKTTLHINISCVSMEVIVIHVQKRAKI